MKYRVRFYEGLECEANVEADNPEEAAENVLWRDFSDYKATSDRHITTIEVYENEEKADQNDSIKVWDESFGIR